MTLSILRPCLLTLHSSWCMASTDRWGYRTSIITYLHMFLICIFRKLQPSYEFTWVEMMTLCSFTSAIMSSCQLKSQFREFLLLITRVRESLNYTCDMELETRDFRENRCGMIHVYHYESGLDKVINFLWVFRELWSFSRRTTRDWWVTYAFWHFFLTDWVVL